MKWLAAFFAVVSLPAPAEEIPVPSGQRVQFSEVIQTAPGSEGLTYRFRFVAPQIARATGTVDPETAMLDMEYLCNSYALPRLSETGPVPNQIVISMSDRPVDFGMPAPEATQFFEAYSIVDNSCIWEGF